MLLIRRVRKLKFFTGLAATAVLCSLAAPALGCGYEDPRSIAAGALNLAFPDSLYLRTALWQAEVDGVLPRDEASSARSNTPMAPRAFTAGSITGVVNPEGIADSTNLIALMQALQIIEQARTRLAASTETDNRPAFAMVYASKMLWTRFVSSARNVTAQTHAGGPESGDVVLITEPSVVQAIVTGKLKPEEAYRRELIRFYGDDAATTAARQWLRSIAPLSEILSAKE